MRPDLQAGRGFPHQQYYVFIRHSSRDTWVARQIACQVEEHGARTFLDANDIVVGADFAEVIRLDLRRAEELVVLWTPQAPESDFVKIEIGGAWTLGTPVVQIVYGLTTKDLLTRPGFPNR